jgi:hypothetical protein
MTVSTPTPGGRTSRRVPGRFSTVLSTGVLALVMAIGLASVGAGAASAASDTTSSKTVVGKSDQGKIKSTVVGKTSEGDKVTGAFTPTRFVQRDGALWAKGFLQGKIHHADGSVTKFSGIKKMPVKKINGQSATDARTSGRAAACDILNLVLGPLDLNVLGLEVHLQRVVLDVVAVAGAGQLLGNLLCAVAGLLDGTPLAGLLGQLSTLLNQILAALNLGV